MIKIKNIITTATAATVLILSGCNQKEASVEEHLLKLTSNDRYICSANPEWITDPTNPPTEIPDGKNAQLCQFYQFSWAWFINLMYSSDGLNRNYQSQINYPVFLGSTTNSCLNKSETSKLFIRTKKDNKTTLDDFVLPTGENQALNNAVIYDQNRNIVLYETRFDRNMCNLDQSSPTLPAGTTELKTSWRKITSEEKSHYVWIQSDTNANGKLDADEIYGLIGFHLVKSTELHPEFIWATFEHRQNAPDCQKEPSPSASASWSFASKDCSNSLPTPDSSCHFNETLDTANPALTGTPTEICQVYAQGTRPGDNQAEKNRDNIITINTQLNAMFNLLPANNSLSVLKNYELVGAIWENDVSLPSSNEANLRGSIQLANTTMETNAQQGFNEIEYTGPSNLQPAAHCFDCHNYSGPKTNSGVSHIFKHIHGSN